MDEALGWILTSSDAERLLSQWLYGDLFVDGSVAPPWPYGEVVGLCDLVAQTPCIANLRAITGDCPGE